MLDLKIADGFVVDGTGAPGYRADIGIRDGRIVEVGTIASPAHRTIEAAGALVTPGFIDMHTHYDAQATWDDELIGSARNGVTTAVMGNCGVGCAPAAPEQRATLTALLSGVEDIPIPVLDVAMDWRWRSFGDYLGRVGERAHTINLAAYVCHGPIRCAVMGARALDGSAPTADDIATMQVAVGEALDAGAIGLSLGRISGHQMEGGGYTADFGAAADEVLALAAAVAARPGKIIQFASDFGLRRPDAATVAELELLGKVAATGVPLSVSLHQWPEIEGGWRRIAAHVDTFNAAGGNVRLEVSARAIGMLMGLELSVHPFLRHPSYVAIADLPFAERLARMREPAFRDRLLAETSNATDGDESVGRLLRRMETDAHRIFVCRGAPDYEPDPATSVKAMADASGLSVMEVYYDALLAGDGRTLLYFPFFNFVGNNLDEQRAMLALPRALFSFGDAGAHSSQICDSAYSSFALSFWGRDRADGLPLERLVHQMTGAQAALFGFADRGRIAPGTIADINIIDHRALTLDPAELRHDLPGGGQRLLQCATGYIATIVAGVPIVEHDAMTGARPGRVFGATAG